MRLVVIEGGMRATGQTATIEEAAARMLRAREEGRAFDARRALDPLARRHRPLTEEEAGALVSAAVALAT